MEGLKRWSPIGEVTGVALAVCYQTLTDSEKSHLAESFYLVINPNGSVVMKKQTYNLDEEYYYPMTTIITL